MKGEDLLVYESSGKLLMKIRSSPNRLYKAVIKSRDVKFEEDVGRSWSTGASEMKSWFFSEPDEMEAMEVFEAGVAVDPPVPVADPNPPAPTAQGPWTRARARAAVQEAATAGAHALPTTDTSPSRSSGIDDGPVRLRSIDDIMQETRRVDVQGKDIDDKLFLHEMEESSCYEEVAANQGWEVHHLDVKSEFLSGELGEEVYVNQLEGYVCKGKEHHVYKLSKASYGFRQAPRAWNIRLDRSLKKLGFTKCVQEQAVYIKREGQTGIIVEFVRTEEQRADALTKALPGIKLGIMSHLLGIRDLGPNQD